jgi:tripartite-type tricarboxylate transporter receptor subunit TctC
MNRIAALLAALAWLASCAGGASADPIADFYRGKTIRMLIGYGPGGGYDLYARLVAEFLAGSGKEMDAITRETFALPPEVRAKIGAMLNAM